MKSVDVFGDDLEIALCAVKNCCFEYQFISKRARQDFEIALNAVKKSPAMMDFVPENLQKDRKFIYEAVKANYYVYKNNLMYNIVYLNRNI